MGKSSINGPFSMAMLNNERVLAFTRVSMEASWNIYQWVSAQLLGCITAKGTVFLRACWKWRWFRHRGWIQWFRLRIDFNSWISHFTNSQFFVEGERLLRFFPLGPPFSTCGLKAWGHCGHCDYCGYASAADAALSNRQSTFDKFLKNGRRQRDPWLDLGDLPYVADIEVVNCTMWGPPFICLLVYKPINYSNYSNIMLDSQ